MHGEIHRFGLKSDGEEAILDTIEPGCLGVVQNYTLRVDGARSAIARTPRDTESGEPDMSAFNFEAAMGLRLACEDFGDEVAVEMSETMWKRSMTWTAADIAASFCNRHACQPKKKKKAGKAGKKGAADGKGEKKIKKKNEKKTKKKKRRKQQAAADDDEFSLESAFKTLDKDGTISALLAQERASPDMMLPEGEAP